MKPRRTRLSIVWRALRLEILESRHLLAGDVIDTLDRGAVVTAYEQRYEPNVSVGVEWSGSVAECNAGEASAATNEAALNVVNYVRNMSGLDDVVWDPALNEKAQQAALMMHAQNTLSHSPDTTWACYTADGAEAAGRSNLYLGRTGASAMIGYIEDPGASNTAVGHRRWIQNPYTDHMGIGSTSRANALWVITPRAALSSPTWVSWPPQGFVPRDLVFPRWSLSRAGANFHDARVQMTIGDQAIPLSVYPVADGFALNTIVWEPTTPINLATSSDTTINVSVENIIVNGSVESFEYDVIAIDPDQAVEIVEVNLIASLVATSGTATTSSFAVHASDTAVADGTGKLDAWIDFNHDGDWNDDGEQIFAAVDMAAGVNVAGFTIPAGARPGETNARFQISSSGGSAPTAPTGDGTARDLMITILDGDAVGGAAVEVNASARDVLEVVEENGSVIVRGSTAFAAPVSAVATLHIRGTIGDDTLSLANLPNVNITADMMKGNDTLKPDRAGGDLDLTAISAGALQGIEIVDLTDGGENVLTLDANQVKNFSPITNMLTVVADAEDTVNIGDGWSLAGTEVDSGSFVRVLSQNFTLRLIGPSDWTNPIGALDVDASGEVSPIDALQIVNELNKPQFSTDRVLFDAASLAEFPNRFYDVTADGFVSPLDALRVINFINRSPSVEEEGGPDASTDGSVLRSTLAFRQTLVPVDLPAYQTTTPIAIENRNRVAFAFPGGAASSALTTISTIRFFEQRRDIHRDISGEAYDRFDALRVIMHELGRLPGLERGEETVDASDGHWPLMSQNARADLFADGTW